jgi:hypothetical protein
MFRAYLPAMRLLIATCVAGALVATGTTATAKPAPPKPDLVTSDVVPVLTGNTLAVYATIKNKGKKRAKATTAAFHLSTDATLDSGDVVVGTAVVPKLKPKKQVTIYPFLTVPGTVAPGSYRVIVCADPDAKVKEKKESNNCAVSPGTVTITAPAGGGGTTPPPGTYNVTVSGFFAPVSVNGDAASSSSRTLNFAAGTPVVLTVTEQAHYPWVGVWQSPNPAQLCDGTEAGAGGGYSMTFSSLSHNVSCFASTTFVP